VSGFLGSKTVLVHGFTNHLTILSVLGSSCLIETGDKHDVGKMLDHLVVFGILVKAVNSIY